MIYNFNFKEQPINESELKTKADTNLWKDQREEDEDIVVRDCLVCLVFVI